MLLTGPMGDLDTSTAKCRGVAYETAHDPEKDRFFPERGTAQITARDAKALCNGDNGAPACPMRSECLEYALERKERFGIWGGKSERERAKIAKQRRVEKRKRELEVEASRRRRSEAAKRAWENRRRAAVELEQAAKQASTRSIKGTSGRRGRGKAA